MGNTDKTPEWKSEAAALRMIGTALEEIEMGKIWKMGGHIGGLSDVPLETGLLPHRMGYAKCLILFDMDKLKEYITHESSEEILEEALKKDCGTDQPVL